MFVAWVMDWQSLNNPNTRADVIKGMITMSKMEDVFAFADLMSLPSITPTEEMITSQSDKVKWHSIEVTSLAPGLALSFAFFAGIGSVLVYSTGKDVHVWVDAMPGDGASSRRRYLETSVQYAFEQMEADGTGKIVQGAPGAKSKAAEEMN